MALVRINYAALNARQKEAYNFQKVSAVLADYGFCTIRLSDDWSGADFIAQHISGTFLRVQLKSRLTFAKKYEGKDLWLCFPAGESWYLYPHDVVLAEVKKKKVSLEFSKSWSVVGGYNFPGLDEALRSILAPYRVAEEEPNQPPPTRAFGPSGSS
jgi:hypothetical protein